MKPQGYEIVTTGALIKDLFLRGKSKVGIHQSFIKMKLATVQKAPDCLALRQISSNSCTKKRLWTSVSVSALFKKIHLQKEH